MDSHKGQDIWGDASAFSKEMKRTSIYAGTFDPITLGHLDLVQRAAHIFDRLVIAVAERPRKSTMFDIRERCKMVVEATRALKNIEVRPFSGLLVDLARKHDIHVLVRGLRAYSDFEYEFQMALTNRKLAPDVETMFLMPKETHSYISSSVVREVAELGGDIRGFVPPCVVRHIGKRFRKGLNSRAERAQQIRD
jgi:pantetheine-phosphate adenylyltransferase